MAIPRLQKRLTNYLQTPLNQRINYRAQRGIGIAQEWEELINVPNNKKYSIIEAGRQIGTNKPTLKRYLRDRLLTASKSMGNGEERKFFTREQAHAMNQARSKKHKTQFGPKEIPLGKKTLTREELAQALGIGSNGLTRLSQRTKIKPIDKTQRISGNELRRFTKSQMINLELPEALKYFLKNTNFKEIKNIPSLRRALIQEGMLKDNGLRFKKTVSIFELQKFVNKINEISKRYTIKQLAQMLGYSKTSIFLAIKNNPEVASRLISFGLGQTIYIPKDYAEKLLKIKENGYTIPQVWTYLKSNGIVVGKPHLYKYLAEGLLQKTESGISGFIAVSKKSVDEFLKNENRLGKIVKRYKEESTKYPTRVYSMLKNKKPEELTAHDYTMLFIESRRNEATFNLLLELTKPLRDKVINNFLRVKDRSAIEADCIYALWVATGKIKYPFLHTASAKAFIWNTMKYGVLQESRKNKMKEVSYEENSEAYTKVYGTPNYDAWEQ